MKIFFLLSFFIPCFALGQSDSLRKESLITNMNKDAGYNRPAFFGDRFPVSLGGYLEANTHYGGTDGVNEGLSFQMRRLTLFMFSRLSSRTRFLTEIEFEDGTKEINIEAALLDFQIHRLLIFRGGVILNPIGSFNQNHDGPKWAFIERPLVSTTLIPSTWSNPGFGFHGSGLLGDLWQWNYEAYLTQGFDDQIIANETNRTFLGATKENPDRFEESFNGSAMGNLKTAFRHSSLGEFGVSWMGGVYNAFRVEGEIVDDKRRVDVFAFDLSLNPGKNTNITGEFAMVKVDVPKTYFQQFGSGQYGFFLDWNQKICNPRIPGFPGSALYYSFRLERVDYNTENFSEIDGGGKIYDELWGLNTGFSLRPQNETVIRINYFYRWHRDLFGNPASKSAALQFGVSSYF
jgi:hypothetical protein